MLNRKRLFNIALIQGFLFAFACGPNLSAAPQGWKDFFRELGNTAREISESQNESGDIHARSGSAQFNQQQQATFTTKEIYNELLASTVWIRTPKGAGTGLVYDKNKGLILTNHHVVEGFEYVQVLPPKFQSGQLITDETEYTQYTRPLTGFVLDSETSKDLALLQVQTPLPDFMKPIRMARHSASPAERVHIVGGRTAENQGMFVYANGHVRQVSKGLSPMASSVWLIQMTVPANPGNSGGAIVNDAAELVGVVTGSYQKYEDVSVGTDIREVNAYVQAVQRLYPQDSAEESYAVGMRHYMANRLESATRHFTNALKRNPKMAAAFRMRGFSYRLKNDFELAMNDFDSAVDIDPADAVAFRGRGLVHKSAGRLDAAKNDMNKAIRLDPTMEYAHYDRGLINWSLKKYDEAVKDFGRTISINRFNPDAFISRGLVFLIQNKVEDALKDFEASATIRPSAVALNNIGVAHRRLKNSQVAMDYFLQATKMDPGYYLAWENLGEVYFFDKRYEDSISHAGYALHLNPNSSRAFYIRAQAELYGGNKHHALNDATKAIRLYPNFATYYALRSEINRALGNDKEANDDLQMVTKLDTRIASRQALAKPVLPDATNVSGRWTAKSKIRGVHFDSVIRFKDNQLSFVSNWLDVVGQKGQTSGQGTFTIKNGTLVFRDSSGQVSRHAVGFKDGKLSLEFPGMNVKQSVLLSKS